MQGPIERRKMNGGITKDKKRRIRASLLSCSFGKTFSIFLTLIGREIFIISLMIFDTQNTTVMHKVQFIIESQRFLYKFVFISFIQEKFLG